MDFGLRAPTCANRAGLMGLLIAGQPVVDFRPNRHIAIAERGIEVNFRKPRRSANTLVPFKLLALGVALVLSGCSSTKLAQNGVVSVINSGHLPPPSARDMTVGFRQQLIGPGDSLRIDVVGLDELGGEVRVDSEGDITMPLAGKVSVIGKDTLQIARDLERGLRATYVRNPKVIVSVQNSISQVVTVEGEVEKPGIYPVVGESTLIRTIARAEGLSDYANSNAIIVFRTVQGQRLAALYDLRAIRSGLYEDPQIYPNDVISVDESRARRLFPVLASFAGVIVAPLVAVLQNSN